MILKIRDTRGWIDWREVRQVQRLGWSSDILDTVPETSEEATRLATEANLALAGTTLLPGTADRVGRLEPIEVSIGVTMSENTSAALRLKEYLGLEVSIHEVPPAPLPPIEYHEGGTASATLTSFAGENPLLWLRIVETDGREHIEGHDLKSAWLMSGASGETLDSLL